jgi:hypothetical protein
MAKFTIKTNPLMLGKKKYIQKGSLIKRLMARLEARKEEKNSVIVKYDDGYCNETLKSFDPVYLVETTNIFLEEI